MSDSPKQAAFRALVRAELEKCETRADERVGPGRLGAMGWGNGRNLAGVYTRIRRQEMERAGFVRGPKGFWERATFTRAAADDWGTSSVGESWAGWAAPLVRPGERHRWLVAACSHGDEFWIEIPDGGYVAIEAWRFACGEGVTSRPSGPAYVVQEDEIGPGGERIIKDADLLSVSVVNDPLPGYEFRRVDGD